MKVALIDTETTGLDPKKDTVIEVGLVIFDTKTVSIEQCYSSLIQANGNPAEATNGISAAALEYAPYGGDIWSWVVDTVLDTATFVAHNAKFDRAFVAPRLKEMGSESPEIGNIPWLCTIEDFDFPVATQTRSLVALAAAHRVPIGVAHRALDDALLIARLFERCHELGRNVDEMFLRAMRPKTRIYATGPRSDNDLYRAAKFHWGGYETPPIRSWYRDMVIEDAWKLPFKWRYDAAAQAATFKTANPARGPAEVKGEEDIVL